MKIKTEKVKYLAKRTRTSPKTGNDYTLATFFDEKTYTKVDLFVTDECDFNGIKEGDLVHLELSLNDRGNLNLANVSH